MNEPSTQLGTITKANSIESDGITWGHSRGNFVVWCVGTGDGCFIRFRRKMDAEFFSQWLGEGHWDGEGDVVGIFECWAHGRLAFDFDETTTKIGKDHVRKILEKYRGEV